MTDPVDWAPFASDGEEFRMLPPLGITYCLTTDDIFKARPTPSIRRYIHGQVGDKMLPETWLPKNPPIKYRNLETQRVVDPLDPKYKLPSGICLMPAGDPLPFSNRVTDLLDTSDIHGSKPGSICKRPLRTCRLHCYIDDASFHPAKKTHVRRRTMFGQGLDLFDIDIGKRKFGFNRSIISNPLEPVYYSETEDLPQKNLDWKKKRVLSPPKDKRTSLEKILDNIYGKVELLPLACQTFDPDNTKQISYGDFCRSLEHFGIKLSDRELKEVLSYADKEHVGRIRYKKFAKVLRSLDNWEKVFPQRLGAELGCPPTNANLGQGVQVLVDSIKPKGSHVSKGSHNSLLYDLFTGEPSEGAGSFSLPREPLASSYGERAAALSKQQSQMGMSGLLCPLPQWPSSKKRAKVSFINPVVVEGSPTQSLTVNKDELCPPNGREDSMNSTINQEFSPLMLIPSTDPLSRLEPKIGDTALEETIVKRESNVSPKKSRQMSMIPYRATNSMTVESNQQSLSPPRLLKARHVISMPFKERIHKEQHKADRHAVQILS